MPITRRAFQVACIIMVVAATAAAEELLAPSPQAPFPEWHNAAHYRGELVFVDHVNRRGSLRLHVDGHFQEGRLHHFALLPSGIVSYHGAPADLRDIPLGTVLYGSFVPPPSPETSVVPVFTGNDPTSPPETHAIRLEDGPSLALRTGRSWQLQSLAINGSEGVLTAVLPPSAEATTLAGEHALTIDHSTRIWRGRELLGMDDLIEAGDWPAVGVRSLEGQPVQLALAWHPRYLYQEFHVSDIWLDAEAVQVAAERQRQRHIRLIRTRWMPALINAVEYGAFGQAVVTITLFGGMDSSLYADFTPNSSGKMAAAEDTLRTWWPDHDGMDGRIISVTPPEMPQQVPLGSSGIVVTFEVPLVLEGFRPGRVVRIRPSGWPNVKPPVEERVRSFEDRWPSPDLFRR